MSTVIKFGTDGWRAIIAEDFTTDNVARVTEGVALWLKQNFKNPSVVVGHDCRFGGPLFTQTIARILAMHNIKTYMHQGIATTPMVSLGTLKKNASLGIIITASHNPPDYNGYKLKGHFGGPLLPADIEAIEKLIPHQPPAGYRNFEIPQHLIEQVNLEDIYYQHAIEHFDIRSIANISHRLAFDPMYGAGQKILPRLLPKVKTIHAEHNPGFHGIPPEPIMRNLTEFSEFIKSHNDEILCGLATDGDADRIGLFDALGNFVDSHHIILLLIKYLVEVKKFTGKVVLAFSVTPKAYKLCKHYGLEYEVVKIGFKHIAGYFLKEKVLLGGEESGGIAIQGHIPERDGIWMGLTIWEYMAKSGKTLNDLIEDVYKIVGPFSYERIDLHIAEEQKQRILQYLNENTLQQIGPYAVEKVETIDGFKYYLPNEEWIMIRASGTEPVLRTYAEGQTKQNAMNILHHTHEFLKKL